jgi:hypothetical protein
LALKNVVDSEHHVADLAHAANVVFVCEHITLYSRSGLMRQTGLVEEWRVSGS